MKKIHKNSCASYSWLHPFAPGLEPFPSETRFLSARYCRSDKSTSTRDRQERYDEKRKGGGRGGLEVLLEFNNHRFFRPTEERPRCKAWM